MGYVEVDTRWVEDSEVMALTAHEFCNTFKEEIRAAKEIIPSRFAWAFRYVSEQRRSKHHDRLTLWRQYMGICHLCGESVDFDSFHIEHVVPLARGGKDVEDNLNIAHPKCNARKGTRLMSELDWTVTA